MLRKFPETQEYALILPNGINPYPESQNILFSIAGEAIWPSGSLDNYYICYSDSAFYFLYSNAMRFSSATILQASTFPHEGLVNRS